MRDALAGKRAELEDSDDEFMGKIASCQTLEGLEELEAYYKKRVKETELKDTDKPPQNKSTNLSYFGK